MNKASMQRRVWENLSQLKVTYRNGPLGRQGRRWFSGQRPLPGDRVPDTRCVRADGGGRTTLYAELGNRWALVLPGPMAGGEHAAVVARRLGDDAMVTLVADHDPDGAILLVRPDAMADRGDPPGPGRVIVDGRSPGTAAGPRGRGPGRSGRRPPGRWPR
jgi:4,5-epoxidase